MENSNPQHSTNNNDGHQHRFKRSASTMNGNMIEEGQKKKRTRRKRKLGPASRALKQYYQAKQFVPAPFRRPAAAATAAASAARSNSTSFEHKYNGDDDDKESDDSSTTLFKKKKCNSFEFKQSDQDLVTPRVPDSSSLHGRTMLDVALSCSIHAPLKKSRRPRYDNDDEDDEEDDLLTGGPPDTARIDLSKETSR